MTQTTTDSQRPTAEGDLVDQVSAVVQALLPDAVGDGAEATETEATDTEAPDAVAAYAALQENVARITEQVDGPTAATCAETLVAHLANDGESLPELEALIVLGLAHPGALEAHAVPLVPEARRLAQLLEARGQAGRAQALLETLAARTPGDRQIDHDIASMMRRNGNADRLVERYMRRAEECVAANHTAEAISWLQEILLVDRSRRDVARMIRDLRWGDQEKRRRLKRAVRAAVVAVVLAVGVVAAVRRELDVADSFREIPQAKQGDLTSMRRRVDALVRFEEEHPLSIQLWQASRERAYLKADIAQLEAKSAQVQIARRSEREAQLAIAESARKQGRIFAQQNRFEEALGEFERALALGPGDWDQRQRIQADVAAIREWIARHAGTKPGGAR